VWLSTRVAYDGATYRRVLSVYPARLHARVVYDFVFRSSLVVEADGTDLLAGCGSVCVIVPVSASSGEFGRSHACLMNACELFLCVGARE
jgi:hypothetical protein